LNLIVTEFVKSESVKPVVKNSHKWASLLHQSGPAMKLYENFQEDEGTPKRKIPSVSFESSLNCEIIVQFLGCDYALEF